MNTKNITTNVKTIQLIQPRIFDEIPYYQCLIEIEHFIFRCGKTIDTFEKSGYYDELFNIGQSECIRLVDHGQFIYAGITIQINKNIDLNFVSIETLGWIDEGSCSPGPPIYVNGIHHDRPVRQSKFRISTKKAKGTIDLEEAKLITQEGTRCNYHENYCLTANGGYTFWDSRFNEFQCGKEQFMPIYEGPATEVIEHYKGRVTTSYILHYQNYDFQVILTGKKALTCGSPSLLTEHPKLSVIVKEQGLPFLLEFKPDKLGKNTNIMTYLNSKLVYTMKHIKDQIESLYEQLMYSKCLAETKLVHTILSSALTAPHEFAYQYFQMEGYTATVRGEVVYLMKCEPLSVNFTQLPPGECYKEIPVRRNMELMFVAPRSRLLSKIGTKLECSNLLPVKYKIMDTWYVVNPNGLIATTNPDILEITSDPSWSFTDINNLASAGIYTPEDLDKIDKIILASIRSEAITQQVNRAIMGEDALSQGMTVGNMMTPEDMLKFGKSKFQSFLDNVLGKLGTFGHFVSIMIGLVVMIKCLLFILNAIVSFRLLSNVFGYSWKLVFFWWDHMVHILLRTETKNLNEDIEIRLPTYPQAKEKNSPPPQKMNYPELPLNIFHTNET